MEIWFIAVILLCVCMLIKAILPVNTKSVKLPPGPAKIPIITNIQWLMKTRQDLEPILKTFHAKYGPIVTLPVGSRPTIFIADRSIAHQALVQNSTIFSDRPKALPVDKVLWSNHHAINISSYNATWRTLRRNLASGMLHPSRLKSFSEIRGWVLDTLLDRLKSVSQSTGLPIRVVDHFRYSQFCLLVFMCFGEKVSDDIVDDIERVQRELLLSVDSFKILNSWPRVTGILFGKRWEKLFKLKKNQCDVLIPLIRARKDSKERRLRNSNTTVSYVDTMLEVELPVEKRKLTEDEMVSLCSEFLDAGTDTTTTALQWIMANLVKYPHVQKKLVDEIRKVMGDDSNGEKKEVKEENLQKIRYLKCVILEGLRCHPPGHFVLPHTVSEDFVLNGHLVPKDAIVNFMVAEMGWDPHVWEDPKEFKPERFLKDEVFDITGSKEIKMMPFGVGKRICPGYKVAILHLEYFVANLIWNFEWNLPEGRYVDLSEKEEFTSVMKYPLETIISPRI